MKPTELVPVRPSTLDTLHNLLATPLLYRDFFRNSDISATESFLKTSAQLADTSFRQDWIHIRHEYFEFCEELIKSNSISGKTATIRPYLQYALPALSEEVNDSAIVSRLRHLLALLPMVKIKEASQICQTILIPALRSLHPTVLETTLSAAITSLIKHWAAKAAKEDELAEETLRSTIGQSLVLLVGLAADLSPALSTSTSSLPPPSFSTTLEKTRQLLEVAITACVEQDTALDSDTLYRQRTIRDGILNGITMLASSHRVLRDAMATITRLVVPLLNKMEAVGWSPYTTSFHLQAVIWWYSVHWPPKEDIKACMSEGALSSAYMGDCCDRCEVVLLRLLFGDEQAEGVEGRSRRKFVDWLGGRKAWYQLFDRLPKENQAAFYALFPDSSRLDRVPQSPAIHFHGWDEARIAAHRLHLKKNAKTSVSGSSNQTQPRQSEHTPVPASSAPSAPPASSAPSAPSAHPAPSAPSAPSASSAPSTSSTSSARLKHNKNPIRPSDPNAANAIASGSSAPAPALDRRILPIPQRPQSPVPTSSRKYNDGLDRSPRPLVDPPPNILSVLSSQPEPANRAVQSPPPPEKSQATYLKAPFATSESLENTKKRPRDPSSTQDSTDDRDDSVRSGESKKQKKQSSSQGNIANTAVANHPRAAIHQASAEVQNQKETQNDAGGSGPTSKKSIANKFLGTVLSKTNKFSAGSSKTGPPKESILDEREDTDLDTSNAQKATENVKNSDGQDKGKARDKTK
ncbi:hypothetical protein SISNIDRAFT_532908 [Sistotremastrum niveocremeum HHB9708]|uniref:Uncharacterized protein n=1 Tax=Sistotremastrum niveocremeum HHB9708 TaxID=1314777 RepID=A0A164NTW8_9AGAM|nr:hypothetical protein SISNIDRAFT_532908 [Sistotremastrum niveocremeum HHB9708]